MKKLSFLKLGVALPIFSMLFTACQMVETRKVKPSGQEHEHSYIFHEGQPAGCETAGIKEYYTCEGCEQYFDKDKNPTTWTQLKVAPLGHDLEFNPAADWVNGTPGHIDYYECMRCHHFFSDENGNHEITDVEDVCHHSGMQAFARLSPSSTTPGHIAYYYCQGCLKYFYDAEGEREITGITDSPMNEDDPRYLMPIQSEVDEDSTFSVLTDNVKAYLSATDESDIIDALQEPTPYNRALRKEISWTDWGTGPYHIYLSTDENLADAKEYVTEGATFAFPGTLIPGMRYYYKVIDDAENLIKSKSTFKVDDTYSLRTIDIDGVHNVRDGGGWAAQGNAKLKYGMIYRGGRLTSISEEGKDTFFNELGIKTELDLRNDGFNETEGDHNYVQCSMNQYTTIIPGYRSPNRHKVSDGSDIGPMVHDPASLQAIKTSFLTLADANNYPIYFHCNAGADRTGTISYLLNGLLGVSYEDILKDFELTTFCPYGNRYRSGVEDDHFVTTGDLAGIYECDDQNYVAFGKLHELMMNNYGVSNGTLSGAIENFLIVECGLTRNTLTQVRKNLLSDDASFDYLVDVQAIKDMIDDLDVDASTPYKGDNLITIQSQMKYLDEEAEADIGENRLNKYNNLVTLYEQKYALARSFYGVTSMQNGAYVSTQSIIRTEEDATYGTVYVFTASQVATDGSSGQEVISIMIIPGALQYRHIRFAIYNSLSDVQLCYLYYTQRTLQPGWNEFNDDLSQNSQSSVANRTADFWIRIHGRNNSVHLTGVEFKITNIYYEK